MLGTLNAELLLGLALLALHSQRNLLSGLRLLVENGLGLTSETSLLLVVSSLTLLYKCQVRGRGEKAGKGEIMKERLEWKC